MSKSVLCIIFSFVPAKNIINLSVIEESVEFGSPGIESTVVFFVYDS